MRERLGREREEADEVKKGAKWGRLKSCNGKGGNNKQTIIKPEEYVKRSVTILATVCS